MLSAARDSRSESRSKPKHLDPQVIAACRDSSLRSESQHNGHNAESPQTREWYATAYHRLSLARFRNPWVFNDAETSADLMRQAGFVEVETSMEPAFTVFENRDTYSEFVRTVILRRHLEEIPDPALRSEFVAELARQAMLDDPLFSLDYWRLNLSGRRLLPRGRSSRRQVSHNSQKTGGSFLIG